MMEMTNEELSASPNNRHSAGNEGNSAGSSHRGNQNEAHGDGHDGSLVESTQPTNNPVESSQSEQFDESRATVDDLTAAAAAAAGNNAPTSASAHAGTVPMGGYSGHQELATEPGVFTDISSTRPDRKRESLAQQLFDEDDAHEDDDIDSWERSKSPRAQTQAQAINDQREEPLVVYDNNYGDVPPTLPGAFPIVNSANATASQQNLSRKIDQGAAAEYGLDNGKKESVALNNDDTKTTAPAILPTMQRELTKEMRRSVVEDMIDNNDLLEYCESDEDDMSSHMSSYANNEIEVAVNNHDDDSGHPNHNHDHNNTITVNNNEVIDTQTTNERFSLSNLRDSNANINVTRNSNSYAPRPNGSFMSDVTISKEFGRDDDDGTNRSVRLSGQYLRNSGTGNTVSAHPVDAHNVEDDEVFRQQLASALSQARGQIAEELQAAMLSNVVVGRVVEEDDPRNHDVHELELTSNGVGRAAKRKYAPMICVCALCILIAVGAAAGITLGSRDPDDSSPSSSFDVNGSPAAPATTAAITTTPSIAPSTILSVAPSKIPSSHPTAALSQFPSFQPTQPKLETILNLLSGQLLENTTTPQYAAFRWLIEEDTIVHEIILNDDTNSEKDVRDRYVAALLYFSLGGSSWRDASLYLDPQSHICFWSQFGANVRLFGIFCEAQERSSPVVRIYLDDWNLRGTIPEEIRQFSTLTHLLMSGNRIQGTLPESIGELTKLVQIDLDNNLLTGTIPASIGHIPNLDTILLYLNKLHGPIPTFEGNMGALRKLVIQVFECNEFTGGIEEIMASIQSPLFEEFFCFCCNLTGTIPADHLKRFTKLRQLVSTNGQISGRIPTEIGLMTDLVNFEVSHNLITGTIPTEIGMNWQLVKLFVSENQLVGTMPPAIGMLLNLRWIEVHRNNLSGAVPEFGGNTDSLQTLILAAADDDDNHFSVHVNVLFSSLPRSSFRGIHCVGCSLRGTLPDDIGTYSVLQHIQLTSDDGSPGLTGTIPTEIGLLQSLSTFRVSNNSLTGEIPTVIGLLEPREMKEFRVANNDLRGIIPSELGMLWGLTSLEVQGNEELVGDLTSLFCPLLNPSVDIFASDCGVAERVSCDCCNECY